MICELCKKNEVAEEGRKVCAVCLGWDTKSVQKKIEEKLYQVGMTCEKCWEQWSERDFTKDGELKKFHLNENLRICCWRKKCADSRSRKIQVKVPKKPIHPPDDDLPEDDHVLILDFTGRTSFLETIRDKAETELRTPENQILWWLITALTKETS